MLRALVLLCFVASFASAGLFQKTPGDDRPVTAASAASRVIFVTRHCEKDTTQDPRDPSLSDAGRKRAQALARMLADAAITQVYTTEFKRTQETGAAVVGHAQVESHVVSGGKPDLLFSALDALDAGTVALVVAHSNTVPAVLAHFGWKQDGADKQPVTAFPEDEFGYVYAITVPPQGSGVAPSIVRLRYGDRGDR